MQELAFPMIENLTFIESQMNRLQKQIEQEGLTEEYQNGSNQKGIKQSASMQTYNSLMKNYVSIYSKLEKMLSHVKEDNKSKLENFKKMIDDE